MRWISLWPSGEMTSKPSTHAWAGVAPKLNAGRPITTSRLMPCADSQRCRTIAASRQVACKRPITASTPIPAESGRLGGAGTVGRTTPAASCFLTALVDLKAHHAARKTRGREHFTTVWIRVRPLGTPVSIAEK
jgi:adenine-specific DNA methylase